MSDSSGYLKSFVCLSKKYISMFLKTADFQLGINIKTMEELSELRIKGLTSLNLTFLKDISGNS